MPTYEYRCSSCEHEFELFQSMSDSVKKKCPECKKLSLERLIGTGAALIFKGSGFYETDYRSDSYKKAAEKDKKASESKPETSAESKPKQENASKAKPDAPSKKQAAGKKD